MKLFYKSRRMKKTLINMCILFVLITSPIKAASYPTNVYVDGKKINSEAFIENDRMYIPIRTVGEELGCEIGWANETSSIFIYKNFEKIELRIGQLLVH